MASCSVPVYTPGEMYPVGTVIRIGNNLYITKADIVNAPFVPNMEDMEGISGSGPSPHYQEKSVVFNDNGNYVVEPDPEFTALKKVDVKVEVSNNDAYFTKSDVWEEVDLPEELSGLSYTTFASRGDIFVCGYTTNSGIWKFNIKEKQWSKIHSSGSYYNLWFETSKGEIFISSSSSATLGMYKLNDSRDGLIQIHAIGYYWQVKFESSWGDIFVSSSTSHANNMGIYKINETSEALIKIHFEFYNWNFWFETSKGEIFVSNSNTTGTGILKLNEQGDGFDQVYNKIGYYWSVFFEDSLGNLFVGGGLNNTATLGILRLNSSRDLFEKIYNSGYGWKLHISSLGEIFLLCPYPTGVYMVKDSEIVQVWSSGVMSALFETSDGEIFVTISQSGGGGGFIKWDRTTNTMKKVFSSDRDYPHWFETSKGEIFAGSNSYDGVLKYNKISGVFTQVFPTTPTTYAWQYFFENDEGKVFVSSSDSVERSWGIYEFDETQNKFVKRTSYGYSFSTRVGKYLISSVSTGLFPIFNIETSKEIGILFSGTVVGNWILRQSQFIKIGDEYPIESYMANSFTSSFKVIGDQIGSVYVTWPTKITFNTKPL